ncbi:hypothetical protein H9P43_007199 [Blastocladiella emersonii ATCC 22665]|nr:hypothetical protein H9P43_007199 [Blastocladiella emersonii ATCC 22665]
MMLHASDTPYAGHLPSLGEHNADPESALQAFVSTCESHFRSVGAPSNPLASAVRPAGSAPTATPGYGPAARLDYAMQLSNMLLETYLVQSKEYFDVSGAGDLFPAFPHRLALDEAALQLVRHECATAGLAVPWHTAFADIPPALAFEASLAYAVSGVAPTPRVALVLRCAIIAAGFATARDVVAQAAGDIWEFPYDVRYTSPSPTPEELDVRRDLLLTDLMSAAAGSPLSRRLLPAAAALTGRSIIALLGRARAATLVPRPIPMHAHAAHPAHIVYLPHVPKLAPLHVSLVPWVGRTSGHAQHAYLIDALDDAAYFAQCMYPVVALRVCPSVAAGMHVQASERRAERVRRRGEEGESEAARNGVAGSGNPFGFVPSLAAMPAPAAPGQVVGGLTMMSVDTTDPAAAAAAAAETGAPRKRFRRD